MPTVNSANTPRHAVASPLDGVRNVPADGGVSNPLGPQRPVPANPGAQNPAAPNPLPNTHAEPAGEKRAPSLCIYRKSRNFAVWNASKLVRSGPFLPVGIGCATRGSAENGGFAGLSPRATPPNPSSCAF